MRRSPVNGQWLILAAAVLWSTGGLGIKNLGLFPLATAGWRSLFSLPILAAFSGTEALRLGSVRKLPLLGTVVAYALTLCLFVFATRLTTAANAILLQFTAPIWVIALSYPVLGERPQKRDYWVVVGCFAGLTMFFLDRVSAEGLLGMILALFAGVSMACLIVGLRYQKTRSADSAAITSVLMGSILCVVACSPWMAGSLGEMGLREWGILATLGCVQLALPYILFTSGLRHVTALRATLLGLVEPVLNPLWVALGKGEIPGEWAMIGGAMILSTLALDAWSRSQRAPLEDSGPNQ